MIHTALVVDDSRTARFMLGKILQRLGVVTATANSAEEALEYLAGHVPDAIFIDHVMPGIDGLHATQKIKADPRFARVPIVIFTAKSGDDYIAQAKAYGAHSVLTKPPTDEYVQGLLDVLGREVEAPPAVEDQPAPAEAARPALDESDVERIARRAVDDAFGSRLEGRLAELVDARLDAFREASETRHAEDRARLDDLAARLDALRERDGTRDDAGAELGRRVEEAGTRLDTLRAEVERHREALAEAGRRGEASDRKLAALEEKVDGLAGLTSRVEAIETREADLAERTDKLVESYVERSSKRYAKAVATYVRKDAATLAEQLSQKHVAALRDELVQAQIEAGHRSVPLLPTVLGAVALIAALGALALALF
ncbi:MAG: response regulator [Gammaproteobacteria bacterium]|nr:response regulator [Gammaproteobacteria bacterium]